MEKMRKLVPFYRRKEEKKSYFSQNGGLLLEDLIGCFGGRYELPIRHFTAEELTRATNNFSDRVNHIEFDCGRYFKGNLQGRPVLVKFFHLVRNRFVVDYAIRDIAVNSQMSHLKNVLHLIGCCLEFEVPAVVYDYASGMDSLANLLCHPTDGKLLSWKSRIKIASDIANVLLYLHTAFPTPIIFRDLKKQRIILDDIGVAKLCDFAFSISLPPGEQKVEDEIIGTFGYIDPEYFRSSFVTEKSDVYSLGALMLLLVTGETSLIKDDEYLVNYVKHRIENDHFRDIPDPKSFEEEGYNEKEIEQHLIPFAGLALRCMEEKGEHRPDMIDVAKQLRQIEKSVRNH